MNRFFMVGGTAVAVRLITQVQPARSGEGCVVSYNLADGHGPRLLSVPVSVEGFVKMVDGDDE